MNCWQCNTELIWGGDEDCEMLDDTTDVNHTIVTNLSCPKCESFVLVYHSKEKKDEDDVG